jgi:mannosyltransferase OCH1-like enzyme
MIVIVIIVILILIYYKLTLPQIPKIVHKIFLSSGEIPIIENNIQNAMNTWKTLNPGYSFKLWYLEDCRKYLKNNFSDKHLETFDNIIPYAYKADFMRYCILYHEGGWYSDWQQVLLVPLDNFKDFNWVSCWDTTGEENTNNGCMQNGFFGSCKGSPILKECISKVIENYTTKNYGKSAWYPTGPCLLGDAFRKKRPFFNVKLGYTKIEPEGPCFFIDSKKVVINKCCVDVNTPATNFKNGNNYIELWNSKQIYN